MSSEKMMILKMLEEGKIDAAEAARLLSAVEGGTVKPQPHTYEKPSAPKPRPEPYSGNNQRKSAPPTDTERTLDNFTNDLSKKFETFARDMEPKIYKFTETVADATGKVADKISKTLASPPPSSPARPTASASPAAPKSGYANMTERIFEAVVTPGYNELNFSGLNGDVLIQGYNGDKISARIYYRAKKAGAPIEIMKLGNKYFLNYEEDDFEKVCIDAFVPGQMFNNIVVATINGQINVSALEPDYLSVSNLDGATTLKDIVSENIKMDCSNGTLKLENLRGVNAKIENFNGNVSALGIDIQNLSLITANGSLGMNIAYFNTYAEYVWAVETSNAKMTLNLPSSPDLGYHLKAHATFSNIKIGLTGLSYIVNDPAYVEAKSINYDRAAKNIKLSLETSNAPLVIN